MPNIIVRTSGDEITLEVDGVLRSAYPKSLKALANRAIIYDLLGFIKDDSAPEHEPLYCCFSDAVAIERVMMRNEDWSLRELLDSRRRLKSHQVPSVPSITI